MLILIFTLTLFCVALLLHFIIWKVRVPDRELSILFQVFLGVLVLGITTLWILSKTTAGLFLIGPDIFLVYLHISLSYITLMLAYIGNYPAIQVDSPSILTILNIANAGPNGLDEDSLYKNMDNNYLIKPRILDLIRAGMIREDKGKYKITKKGTIFLKPFLFYRKILNTPTGG